MLAAGEGAQERARLVRASSRVAGVVGRLAAARLRRGKVNGHTKVAQHLDRRHANARKERVAQAGDHERRL